VVGSKRGKSLNRAKKVGQTGLCIDVERGRCGKARYSLLQEVFAKWREKDDEVPLPSSL
jgi:hypothetical protein